MDVAAIGDRALAALSAAMSAEERGRGRRFVQIEDRRSFAAAHGGLRFLLGAMLGAPPQSFAFAANAYGKPRLDPDRGIAFNMSHSGGIVLIGLAPHLAVGVDVEALRPLSERDAIVRRYFHPGEAADFARVPPSDAEGAFFRCWSRKEAVVKALGLGMSLDLHRYRVTCTPGDAPRVLALEGEPEPDADWSLIDLDVGPGHVGAVAARHRPLTVIQAAFDASALA